MAVPRPHWHLSARRVLTTDWAEGIAMSDIAALRAAGHDLQLIGTRVLQLFLRHALRDGYFHADMHQGNLKVAANGDIVIYDFGIMGEIDEYTRRIYAEILMGFIRRDYVRVAEVHFEAGYVPRDRDIHDFARALRAVGEPIFGMEANQISMARLLAYLFEVTERFGMQTRTELILLQRTMVVVEGVARSLDAHINIWQVAKPIVEDYVRRNVGPQALLRDLGKTMLVLSRFGPKLPQLAEITVGRGVGKPGGGGWGMAEQDPDGHRGVEKVAPHHSPFSWARSSSIEAAVRSSWRGIPAVSGRPRRLGGITPGVAEGGTIRPISRLCRVML